MTRARCGQRQRARHEAASRRAALRRALPLLLGAAVLVAATGTTPELRVEAVDDSYPAVELLVSAPGLEAEPTFDVSVDGAGVPVEAEPVPPRDLEVVLLVASSVDGDQAARVRSVVIDFVLRLPPGTRVSIVGTAGGPEVLAGSDSTLQSRVLAASRVRPGATDLGAALALALEQFSGAPGRVRRVVVVGDAAEGSAVPGDLSGPLTARRIALDAVPPGSDAASDLIARLSSLYHLTFEGDRTGEVLLGLSVDGQRASVPVALRGGPGDAAGEATGGATAADAGASTPGGTSWPAVLLPFAALGLVLLSASIVVPAVAAGRRAADAWERAAARVAWEIGAWEAVSEVSEDVARQRGQWSWDVWAAGRHARLAATVLAVQPIVVWSLVVLAGWEGPAQADARPSAVLLAALGLTVGGAWWLRRAARPPFSPWPTRWLAHGREAARRQQLTDTFDRARLYAAGGLPEEEALARGGAGWHARPGRLLALAPAGQAAGTCPADRFAAASAGLRSDAAAAAREQARGGVAATVVPFLACTLPAIVLVLVAT